MLDPNVLVAIIGVPGAVLTALLTYGVIQRRQLKTPGFNGGTVGTTVAEALRVNLANEKMLVTLMARMENLTEARADTRADIRGIREELRAIREDVVELKGVVAVQGQLMRREKG